MMANDNSTSSNQRFMEEFYKQTINLKSNVKLTIFKKLGQFPEATDIEYIWGTCISDIERILLDQLNAAPEELFNNKERERKLALFKKDPLYIKKYLLEATKSFCRKKQHYWTHGRNKANRTKGEKHKERKVGKAARIHYSKGQDGNDIEQWMDNLIASDFTTNTLQTETIMNLNIFFERIGLDDKKIDCFWDRFSGLTFVEMAEQDPIQNVTADKYRKRFKRILLKLSSHSVQLKEILLGRYN